MKSFTHGAIDGWEINVAGLDKWADRHGARHLSAFRVHRQDTGDFVL